MVAVNIDVLIPPFWIFVCIFAGGHDMRGNAIGNADLREMLNRVVVFPEPHPAPVFCWLILIVPGIDEFYMTHAVVFTRQSQDRRDKTFARAYAKDSFWP